MILLNASGIETSMFLWWTFPISTISRYRNLTAKSNVLKFTWLICAQKNSAEMIELYIIKKNTQMLSTKGLISWCRNVNFCMTYYLHVIMTAAFQRKNGWLDKKIWYFICQQTEQFFGAHWGKIMRLRTTWPLQFNHDIVTNQLILNLVKIVCNFCIWAIFSNTFVCSI